MPIFKHSGTSGDTLSSLPVIRHFGGNTLLMPLHNLGMSKVLDKPGTAGRMEQQDFDFLAPLILNTGYIQEFKIFKSEDMYDYNLDNFRQHYEKKPYTNLIGYHFRALGKDILADKALQKEAYLQPFLKVNKTRKIQGKTIGVSWTNRHKEGTPLDHPFWRRLINEGLDETGVYFGFPQEHSDFERIFQTKIAYQAVTDALELAEYIEGLELFICSPTMNYWIATGLQKTTLIETRQASYHNLYKWEDNECNTHRPNCFVFPYLDKSKTYHNPGP